MELSVAKLLEDMRMELPKVYNSKVLNFTGIDKLDVYNVTSPFEFKGDTLIAGRVEPRESEISSVIIFKQTPEGYTPLMGTPPLREHQDPCIAIIRDQIIIGCVNYPVRLGDNTIGWRMSFYRTDDFRKWELVFTGPDKMKDIRLIELNNGKIGIFTRPQGEIGGRGTIGFTSVSSFDDITSELLENAPLIENMFLREEWGGANQILHLNNGLIGVLGHIGCLDDDEGKHYYPITFSFNPETGEAGPVKILLDRFMLPYGPAKKAELEDVVFSGGIQRIRGGRALFYAGISDAFSAYAEIDDPFLEYE